MEVNIWRLSDARGKKVWYEWSAEAFLAVPQSHARAMEQAQAQVQAGGTSMPGSASLSRDGMLSAGAGAGSGDGGSMMAPLKSPLVDAPFSPARASFSQESPSGVARVKIGQTGLHNVGGVHSWVGL